MKTIKMLMMAATALIAGMSLTACGDDDDDTAQSNYERYQQAVNQTVNSRKKSRKRRRKSLSGLRARSANGARRRTSGRFFRTATLPARRLCAR